MSLYSKKRCLVIGASGFIGCHLVRALLLQGATVIAVGFGSQHVGNNDAADFLQIDLNDQEKCRQLANQPYQYIFNLSGYVDHAPFFSGGRAVIENHYDNLMNVLQVIDRSELKGFIQIGSSDEYGNQAAPQQESMRESPISPYSAAKVSATHLIQMLSNTEGFPGVVLRFFLVYGPGQNDQRFIPQIIKGCLNDNIFPTSAGEQLRDFCYIDDVVEAMLLAAQSQAVQGQVINIASGQPTRIRDVIETIQAKVGRGQPLFGQHPYRKGENMALYADVTKAKQLLGWTPKVAFEDGITQCIEHMKKTLKIKEAQS